MARSVGYFSHDLCYTTEVSSIIRGHHVYMSVWNSTIGETLNTKPDNRERPKITTNLPLVCLKEISLWVMY